MALRRQDKQAACAYKHMPLFVVHAEGSGRMQHFVWKLPTHKPAQAQTTIEKYT